MENVLFHLASEVRFGHASIAAIMPVGRGIHAVMVVRRDDKAITQGTLYRSLKAAREAATIAART
jgi:hypothetical protein